MEKEFHFTNRWGEVSFMEMHDDTLSITQSHLVSIQPLVRTRGHPVKAVSTCQNRHVVPHQRMEGMLCEQYQVDKGLVLGFDRLEVAVPIDSICLL